MRISDYDLAVRLYEKEAAGWAEGIYSCREVTYGQNVSSYLSEEGDITALKTRMWTETEATGFGIYPYVEGVVFRQKTNKKDGKWTIVFANPTDADIKVSVYADEVLFVKEEVIASNSEREISFEVCSIHDVTEIMAFVHQTATAKEDSKEETLYIKSADYEELPAKTKGDKPKLFIASDSTVQSYEAFYYPQTGWGQVFNEYIKSSSPAIEEQCTDKAYPQCHTYTKEAMVVENRSIGARSARSFIDEGKWDALLKRTRPGDYCIIQWAHNDATAIRPNRYVKVCDFDSFLMKYVESCRSRLVNIIFVTPVSRRNCDEHNGEFPLSFGEYADVMLEVGKRENVPTVDLCRLSNAYLNEIGSEEAKSIYLWAPAGAYPDGAYADGVSDNTHLQEYGAKVYAKMVAKSLLELKEFPELKALQDAIDVSYEPQKPVIKASAKQVNPQVPSGFALQEVNVENKMCSFLLIWNDVEGAKSYNVYRKGSVDFQFFPLRSVSAEEKKGAAVLPFTLPAMDVYQVRVTAVFPDGSESEPSRIIEFRA